MNALVYHGPGQKKLEERAKPAIQVPSDAVVKIRKTTLCGTGLHILKGEELLQERLVAAPCDEAH